MQLYLNKDEINNKHNISIRINGKDIIIHECSTLSELTYVSNLIVKDDDNEYINHARVGSLNLPLERTSLCFIEFDNETSFVFITEDKKDSRSLVILFRKLLRVREVPFDYTTANEFIITVLKTVAIKVFFLHDIFRIEYQNIHYGVSYDIGNERLAPAVMIGNKIIDLSKSIPFPIYELSVPIAANSTIGNMINKWNSNDMAIIDCNEPGTRGIFTSADNTQYEYHHEFGQNTRISKLNNKDIVSQSYDDAFYEEEKLSSQAAHVKIKPVNSPLSRDEIISTAEDILKSDTLTDNSYITPDSILEHAEHDILLFDFNLDIFKIKSKYPSKSSPEDVIKEVISGKNKDNK